MRAYVSEEMLAETSSTTMPLEDAGRSDGGAEGCRSETTRNAADRPRRAQRRRRRARRIVRARRSKRRRVAERDRRRHAAHARPPGGPLQPVGEGRRVGGRRLRARPRDASRRPAASALLARDARGERGRAPPVGRVASRGLAQQPRGPLDRVDVDARHVAPARRRRSGTVRARRARARRGATPRAASSRRRERRVDPRRRGRQRRGRLNAGFAPSPRPASRASPREPRPARAATAAPPALTRAAGKSHEPPAFGGRQRAVRHASVSVTVIVATPFETARRHPCRREPRERPHVGGDPGARRRSPRASSPGSRTRTCRRRAGSTGCAARGDRRRRPSSPAQRPASRPERAGRARRRPTSGAPHALLRRSRRRRSAQRAKPAWITPGSLLSSTIGSNPSRVKPARIPSSRCSFAAARARGLAAAEHDLAHLAGGGVVHGQQHAPHGGEGLLPGRVLHDDRDDVPVERAELQPRTRRSSLDEVGEHEDEGTGRKARRVPAEHVETALEAPRRGADSGASPGTKQLEHPRRRAGREPERPPGPLLDVREVAALRDGRTGDRGDRLLDARTACRATERAGRRATSARAGRRRSPPAAQCRRRTPGRRTRRRRAPRRGARRRASRSRSAGRPSDRGACRRPRRPGRGAGCGAGRSGRRRSAGAGRAGTGAPGAALTRLRVRPPPPSRAPGAEPARGTLRGRCRAAPRRSSRRSSGRRPRGSAGARSRAGAAARRPRRRRTAAPGRAPTPAPSARARGCRGRTHPPRPRSSARVCRTSSSAQRLSSGSM